MSRASMDPKTRKRRATSAAVVVGCTLVGVGAPALSAQSPLKPIKVQSCTIADSLLGPIAANDTAAIVRLYYVKSVDSTRLVAGPERTYSYEEQGPHVMFMTSYGDHHPTVYPHLNVLFLLSNDPIAVGRPGESSSVTMIIDGAVIPLGSVTVPSGGPAFSFTMKLTPNQSFLLAGAGSAIFTIEHVSHTTTAHELRDVRGMYRATLCGQAPSPT